MHIHIHIHSFTHSFTHSLTHSLTHVLTHSLQECESGDGAGVGGEAAAAWSEVSNAGLIFDVVSDVAGAAVSASSH